MVFFTSHTHCVNDKLITHMRHVVCGMVPQWKA
nr:MAG TPA: hypothetical protein [Caudoviricetes sp.]DAW47389.1 MAG TPA: hypothetical protein [Caudoviricetes sp.]